MKMITKEVAIGLVCVYFFIMFVIIIKELVSGD